ncbi:nucleolar protein 12 isoform X1 [Onychostruthus taczanowskii]|uniref:nucleolar protein 12 isoform X1 n=1 Tax=Onychostruthus taczanowskii TaxID=356909 RepID=UPI001B80B179|nr:nucleolar protein 12 isoform X1 [Onychostruthus taczanowskii]
MGRKKNKKGSAREGRLVVTFDEKQRREYLTGFHKRKVERRKAALEEIKRKLKKEQNKIKEERHQEYLKMLSEREEALEEADELEHLVTSRTESVNIDHPNHIVTVTTISDLDLSGARQLGLTSPVDETKKAVETPESQKCFLVKGKTDGSEEEKGEEVVNKPVRTMPKKSRNPFLSEKISSLTATLHMHSQKKTKRKRSQRGQGPRKKIQKSCTGRTTKTQRRRLTGKMGRDQD